MSFSPNTISIVREGVRALFGILVVYAHEIYLGLPTFSMRNKTIQHGYIRDQVIKKLQGWKDKLFSMGGKEVLLKSIIQSILTYAMSCFTLPCGIIRDIEVACARFWWGSNRGKWKIHWKSWRVLCKLKSEGGMGFRDLSVFNQALLGKQIWRLIKRLVSMVALVFKAKYYSSSSIWEVDEGPNPSFIW
ncbi:hypothetical protein UlMin_032501 [Ulmus minor]